MVEHEISRSTLGQLHGPKRTLKFGLINGPNWIEQPAKAGEPRVAWEVFSFCLPFPSLEKAIVNKL
jgi:hypothetical protein